MFQSKSLLKEIAESSVNGIIVTDTSGTIKGYNSWCTSVLGWSPEVEVGKNLAILHPFSFKEPYISQHFAFPEFFEKCKKNRAEFSLTDSTGAPFPVQFAVREIKNEDGILMLCYLINMSDHYAFEEKRKELETRLNSLASNIPGIVFQCSYEKSRPIQFIGTSIEELAGLAHEDLVSGKVHYSQLMSPEDEQRIWHAIGLSLQRGDSYTVEYRLIHQSGRTTWVTENGRVVRDSRGVPQSIVGVIFDNTLTKTGNAEFESTVNALNKATAVVEFDLSGCVITANDHFIELMGYESLEEIQGHHHSLFCSPEFYTSPEYGEFWDSLRSGQFASGEYLRIGKGGKECWIQATYNPILDADGRPYKVKKFATDLSDRKAMEKDLRVAIDKAEAAVAARGYFMANMSHEIRTPMNSIIGFTELLLDSEVNKEQRHQLEIVRNASRSLLRLLNEILDMSKLEKGAVELEITDFNFMDLCEQIVASLKINAEQKGIDLLLNVDSSVPVFLKGDSLRIQQVLLNLLSNAIKFTEKGSVALGIKYVSSQLHIEIADTGIGIDKMYLNRIFDPFTQAEASTTRRFGGTGLGTAISRQLVELMQGTINVESELNVGTTFYIDFPIQRGQAQRTEKSTDFKLPPMYILAVDDTPNNLELVKVTMHRAGHKVDLVDDGEKAVKACKKRRYDLVLMDMQMPKMDGLKATRQIRAYEKSKNLPITPIIAFSASVLEQDRQDALAAGMQGFAAKPLDPPNLFGEISRVLTEMKEEAVTVQQKTSPQQEKKEVIAKESSLKKTNAEGENKDKKAQGSSVSAFAPAAINWKAGLQLWGDEELFTNSIKTFLQDNKKSAFSMEEMLKSEDFERLSAQAHKISGAAGNLSLSKIHKLAKSAEIAAHKKEKTALGKIFPELDLAFNAVAFEIEKKLQRTQTKALAATLDKKNSGRVHAELQQLIDTLKRNESPEDSLKALVELLPQESVASLQKAIQDFDFEQAIISASELKKNIFCGKL